MIDWDQKRWKSDIESFARWRKFLDTLTDSEVRARVIARLQEYKNRWPRYIKDDDIPHK